MKRSRPPKPVYRCQTCGDVAHYGYGVTLRSEGQWFCASDRPAEKPDATTDAAMQHVSIPAGKVLARLDAMMAENRESAAPEPDLFGTGRAA